jgi:phenylalanyl-tRNA synthetase beta chain
MKIPIKWLKDYVDIVVSPEKLADALNMSGNEVETVITIGANWENLVVGQVTAINPHPNADKLRLATVDSGKGQETVVCGAWNYNIGDKIVFASVGAVLTDGHTGQTIKLKPAKIRGVESRGMICSEMELGISREHTGIMILPADAPLGTPLKDYLGDTIINLDVTPNRPDCLSIIGIAREAAALKAQKTHIPEPHYPETGEPLSGQIQVEIEAQDLCLRYCVSLVKGVTIKPSPQWLQDRLIACGLRPINNIVDISNYVMLEYGQPLHTFDYDLIRGKKIIVRRAHPDEQLTTLDGIDRKLNPEMLVIADATAAIALAGVMGGANSEVTQNTHHILLESASFKATSVHATGEALGLPSEARYRFERGIPPGLTIPALKRATQLLVELGGGQAAPGYADIYPGKKQAKPVKLSLNRLHRLLGIGFSRDEVLKTLESLSIECRIISDDEIEGIAPYWRSDINIEEDLIEEVARIQGYNKIPVTLLAEPLPQIDPDPILKLKDKVRESLVANGFAEVINFSLSSLDLLKKVMPDNQASAVEILRVANPMTVESEYLRTSLRGNLLTAFASNRKYQEGSIRLFELSKVYLGQGTELPDERETLCGVMGGLRYNRSWLNQEENLDFYDAKGVIEGLLLRLGLAASFEKGRDLGLHANKQADIFLAKQKIGRLGELHPQVAITFDIHEPVYLIELDLKNMVQQASAERVYHPVGRFPATSRDMALIVGSEIQHQQIREIACSYGLVELVEIFDVYTGEQVPDGKKSLAYRVSYRSASHTLTDEEVTEVHQQILERLGKELGALLRS